MGLPEDHTTYPDSTLWDPETGETYGQARFRFSSFGPEVPWQAVPALVKAGLMVWSFGYGDDPAEFTVISEDDLDWFDSAENVADWAPFRLDVDQPTPEPVAPQHTVRGQTSAEGWDYGVSHDMDCPACLASGSSFTASPRSETYWSS